MPLSKCCRQLRRCLLLAPLPTIGEVRVPASYLGHHRLTSYEPFAAG